MSPRRMVLEQGGTEMMEGNDPKMGTATIDVLVCKGFSGQIVRATIDPTETVQQALPRIADQIAFSSADWERIGLYNMTRDFEYRMDERFDDRGTMDGDLLLMADGAAAHR